MTSVPKSLLLVFTLAFLLRTVNINQTPSALYQDELAIGYNALSIGTTLKDEYGQLLPFWFESYGDYKLPTYIYLTTPLVTLFGINHFTVRLVSILAGSLATIGVYWLVQLLLKPAKAAKFIAFYAALIWAVSPWSLQFSRAGFEANLAVTFLIFGIATLIYGLTQKPKFLYLSLSLLVLSMFTYNTCRLVSPLLFLTVLLIIPPKTSRIKKHLLSALITITIFTLPLLFQLFSPQGFARAQEISIFSDENPNNFNQFISNFSANLDPHYLFFRGDSIGRHSIRTQGMLLIFELVTVPLGIIYLLRHHKKPLIIMLFWILISLLPSALTLPSPHSLRTLNVLPAWVLFSSIGIYQLITQAGKLSSPLRSISTLVIITLLGYGLSIYYSEYFLVYRFRTGPDWNHGFAQAAQLISKHQNDHDHIFLTSSIPPIYLAAYLPISPQDFQSYPLHQPTGSFGKITYRQPYSPYQFPANSSSLVITTWEELPPAYAKNVGTIRYPNQDIAFYYWFYQQ